MSLISRHSYKLLAEEFKIADSWREIPANLTALKSKQEITLVFEGAQLSMENDRIEASNGVAIDPFAEVKDAKGTWHSLGRGSYGVSGVEIEKDIAHLNRINFPVKTTENKSFVAVRIRATEPVTCKLVLWHCYYPK